MQEIQMTGMELLPAVVSVATVVISLWSLKVARRTEQVQLEAAVVTIALERRNSAAVHLQKYSELLSEVRDATKAAKQEIHHSADEVLRSLLHLVDDIAASREPRYSRHLFHEMSERIFESLAPELSFQPGEHMLMRYAGVRRKLRELSDACKRGEDTSDDPGWFAHLRTRLTFGPVPSSDEPPEQRLLSSNGFVRVYGDLDSRLDSDSGRRLMLESIDRVEKFCEVQRKLREAFENAHQRLTAALDKNTAEEFKVKESRELWVKVEAEMRALSLMKQLGLNDLKYFRNHDVLDALPEFVYAGAVLYTAARVADQSAFSSEPMRY